MLVALSKPQRREGGGLIDFLVVMKVGEAVIGVIVLHRILLN